MKKQKKSRPAGKVGTKAATRVRTGGGAEVVGRAPLETHIFEVADAIGVHRAVVDHLALLRERGLTDAEVAAFAAQIELAKQVEGVGGRLSLDALRQTVKDLAGDYRTAADLACTSMDGRDAALAKALACDGKFPDNDADLDRYLGALAAPMAAHAARLVARGFPAAEQAALVEAAAEFHAALTRRPQQQEALDALIANRQAVLKRLHANTRYMRVLGRAATRKTPGRAAFDRARPEAPGARVQVEAKRALAKAKRAEAEAAKAAEAATKAAALKARAEADAARRAARKKGK